MEISAPSMSGRHGVPARDALGANPPRFLRHAALLPPRKRKVLSVRAVLGRHRWRSTGGKGEGAGFKLRTTADRLQQMRIRARGASRLP